MDAWTVGDALIEPRVVAGELRSIGQVTVGGVPLRNPANRFLPWFDTLDGEVFRRFRLERVELRGKQTVLHTTAISDPDVPFMERRDASGDVVLRQRSWDAEPLEVTLRIVLEPAAATVDGRAFTGIRYWYEYESESIAIHRLLDRQTWEVGGDLSDCTVVSRCLFDLPRKRLGRDVGYSTVGLDNWAALLPGNLWGRWSLLQPFDMQYGAAGVTLGWFDRCSLVRSVIETTPGEDWLRIVDAHYVTNSTHVTTNAKTILHCPDVLDDVDALNLWTRVHDREKDKWLQQYGMRDEGPPQIVFSLNTWKDFDFATTYQELVDQAAHFGADIAFIDPCWENGESVRRTLEAELSEEARTETVLAKLHQQNMCCTVDFEVSAISGGEAGLRQLCADAAAKGVRVISWMSTHYTPRSILREDKHLGHGLGGIFACGPSGRHPDTGYPGECWTVNMNAPVYDKIRKQVLGVCDRTGLHGYLWDSYCNLGWWQLDYSAGDMRPQFDKMCQLYADIINAGHYIKPEALVSFSNNSCVGLHGGNIYRDDLLGYSYNTVIGLTYKADGDEESTSQDQKIIRGELPIDLLFQSIAHRRVPGCSIWQVPADARDADAEAAIIELFRVYREQRDRMHTRTVLKDDRGVRWDSADGGDPVLFFSFRSQSSPIPGPVQDAASGDPIAPTQLQPNRVYRIG